MPFVPDSESSSSEGRFVPDEAPAAKVKAAPTSTPDFSGAMKRLPPLALPDALATMGSSMIAKPVSDIAGLAATGKEMIRPTPGGGDPEGFRRSVQERLQYQPRTPGGDAIARYNPLTLLGRGIGWGADKLQGAMMPPDSRGGMPAEVQRAIARGTGEAAKQAPGFVGAGAGRAGGAVARGMEGEARSLMGSALKAPIAAGRTGKTAKAIDTLLEEGVNVTKGGVETLRGKIDEIQPKIDALVKNSPAVIDKQHVGAYVQGTIDKFLKQVNSADDVAAAQKAWDEFLAHPSIPTSGKMSVELAQEMKKGTYKQLGDKAFGELKTSSIEAQKALARGLKEEIARAIPQVRPLNAQEGKLLNALSLTERRVLMSANKNPIGLGLMSTAPAKLAAWMADRSEAFKSIVARMLYSGSKAVGPGARVAGPPAGLMMQQGAQGLPPPPQQSSPGP